MLIVSPLLLLVSAQVTSPPETPNVPAFFTGESLYEICSRPNHGQCSMYVAGVLDGVFLSQAHGADGAICRAPLNNQEAALAVTAYLGEHLELRPAAAAVGVRAALQDVLTCDTSI